ncbi:MAG: HPF/RaiA family ribosome-associated protein [Bacteroidota bacterium]|nr:RNA polymerase subunit sigma-54 [Flavobacteriaceae bacterium]MEC8615742.1 HPF/RaiA family ribosome-associated protein [Bacteroidota bacterium]|tara:strand:+ start:306 stop:599 length:294 start_codon:yes stop_codon:yes gene_type:complete
MILNFQSLNFKLDKKLKKFSNKKISKLELFYKKIIDIKVLFKIENSTNSVNKFVEFIVRIPGNNIVVKSTAVSFKESISNNVKSVERILKRKKFNFT